MAYTKGTGNWKDKWGAATEKGAQRTQQDQAWYQSHKEIADQARKQLANNGGMSGTQFGRKPSVPQYIGNTSNNNSTSGTSGTSGKDSYSGRPTTTYDPTAQLNAFYAQQQAYIANQMQNRNLGQQLAAMGRSGGASESTMLGLANEYGNARGELDRSRNDQLATLAAQLAEGKASDLDAYNQAKAAYDKDYQDRLADLAAASLDRLLNYDNTYTSGLTQIEQNKAQTLAQIQAAQNQALMEAQQALAEQQAAALYRAYGGGGTSEGSLTTQPAASNNEQNDNTAAQIRAAAAARARYEAIKDEQAEERLTGIAQGTEMAPKNSQNPLLNWSPKSFPGLTIQ